MKDKIIKTIIEVGLMLAGGITAVIIIMAISYVLLGGLNVPND